MELIKADDLSLAFDGKVAAEHVNFTLSSGDYLCVVGENGSGKSTLLRAITGELTPYRGKLILSDVLKKNGIGYLPQTSKIQHDFPVSVKEAVISGCIRKDHLGVIWSRESHRKADEMMEMLSITSLSSRSLSELSGGQRQRVLLARAMCASDTLLLLDEPVTGLDPDAAHEMYEAIRTINKTKKCAVMMVTHDVQCALEEAELVLSMCSGHSFFGSVSEYVKHEEMDKIEDHDRHHRNHEKEGVYVNS